MTKNLNLKIIVHPDKRLRQKSRPLTLKEVKSDSFRSLTEALVKLMLEKDGAGLAAPQVGESLRLIVIRKDFENNEVIVMINPKISSRSWAKSVEEEGCLSVVDKKGQIMYGAVERAKKINCVYLDLQGQKQKLLAVDLLARIIQHENDHLDGILFIDKLYDDKTKKKN